MQHSDGAKQGGGAVQAVEAKQHGSAKQGSSGTEQAGEAVQAGRAAAQCTPAGVQRGRMRGAGGAVCGAGSRTGKLGRASATTLGQEILFHIWAELVTGALHMSLWPFYISGFSGFNTTFPNFPK